MINLQEPSILTQSLRFSHASNHSRASNQPLDAIELEKPKSIHSSRLKEIPTPIEVLSDDEEKEILEVKRKE